MGKLVLNSLFGCLLLYLFSFIRFDVQPIPFTLQTLGIFLIAIFCQKEAVLGSTMLYLILATMGAPVFGGHSDSLWFLHKKVGYLLAFPISGLVISTMKRRHRLLPTLLIAQSIIFLFGWIGLSFFINIKKAFFYGVILLLPSAIFKMALTFLLTVFKQRLINTQAKNE